MPQANERHPVERLAQAVAAFRASNRHAAIAIGHQRRGDYALAWEHGCYARFYRRAALGFASGRSVATGEGMPA